MTISRSFLNVSIISFLVIGSFAHAAFSEIDRPAPDVTLYATPSAVALGQSSALTWTSKYASSCIASSGWSGSKERNGTRTITPTATATYSLSCSGRGGTTAVSVTITVNEAPVTPPLPPPLPPVTPTTTPPLPPPPPTTPTTTPPVTPPTTPTTTPPVVISCPIYTTLSCGLGNYVTTGPSDANGCIGAPRCTAGTIVGASQYVSLLTDTGGATRGAPVGSPYGGTGATGPYALVISVPVSAPVQNKVEYALTLDGRKVWWLTGKVGLTPVAPVATTTTPKPPTKGSLLGATYGGSARVTITAVADKIDSTDAASQVVYDSTVTPATGVGSFKVPLGVWGMRPNLKLQIVVQKTLSDALQYSVILDGLNTYSFGDRPDQGLVRNDLMWASADVQAKVLASLAQFNVGWLHDSIRTTGSSWTQAPLLKRIQDQGKKIQLVVGQVDEDYDAGTGARVLSSSCPWGFGLPLSKVNLSLYEKRLKANLSAYKNAGVDVKAVEVGNELDLFCFNGDVPLGRAATDADYKLFAESYAKFLEKSVSVIKRPEYYPNAKIILGSPAIDWSPTTGKMDPGRMYAALRNVAGRNYFDLVDGVGVHFYPWEAGDDGSGSVARTNAYLATIGEQLRPLWITEWGFYNNRFANATDHYRAFVTLYDRILRADFKVIFMANFALDEFNFPFNVVDASYNKLSEARYFDQYPSPVPSAVIAERPISDSATACVGCGLRGWLDETWANVRDFVLRTSRY